MIKYESFRATAETFRTAVQSCKMAWMRWPNVGLWLVGWLMVDVGFVTLGQRRDRRATLHWANADCQRWPNVATDTGPRYSSGTMAQRKADEQTYVGSTLFYDVRPTCINYHGQTLAQHSHAIWVLHLHLLYKTVKQYTNSYNTSSVG